MDKFHLELLECKLGGLLERDIDVFCNISVIGTLIFSKSKSAKSNKGHVVFGDIFDIAGIDLGSKEPNTLCIELRDNSQPAKMLAKCNVALEALREGKVYHVWLKMRDELNSGIELRVKVSTSRHQDTKSASNKLVASIIEYCTKNVCKFEDKEFPAGDYALYKDGNGTYSTKNPKNTIRVDWKRPNEFCGNPQLFVDGVEEGDVIQGALGDCYFLGALSVVATRKELLEPLVVAAHPEFGFYQFKLFKNGEWHVVTIDDRIPVYGGTPIYSKCKDNNEIWVPLFEKAYAKIHGSYEAIEAGSIAAALTDLTGEYTQIFNFDDANVKKQISEGTFWKDMKYFIDEAFLMGCSFNSTGGAVEEDTGKGILQNHAYGVLNVKEPRAERVNLVSIRNPWGRLEWNGRYSDNSKEWTPNLMKELDVTFADDGTFWMCMEDYTKEFNQMIVLRLLTDDIGKQWQKQVFEGEWRNDNGSAGGSTNNPTWRNNPQYGVVVKIPDTKIFISLSQPDQRMKGSNVYSTPIGIHLVKTNDARSPKITLTNVDIVTKISYTPSREVSISATLPVGEYIVIPSTYNPNSESNYWLTIYSEEPVESALIKRPYEIAVKSEWKGELAGGSVNHLTWIKNPKFLVTLDPSFAPLVKGPVKVTTIIRQPERKTLFYVGMYTGKYNSGQLLDRSACRNAKPCLNGKEVAVETNLLPEDFPRYLIPHTFEANQETTFEIHIQSSAPLKITTLQWESSL